MSNIAGVGALFAARNYLQQCYDETPELKKVSPVTVGSSLKCIHFTCGTKTGASWSVSGR